MSGHTNDENMPVRKHKNEGGMATHAKEEKQCGNGSSTHMELIHEGGGVGVEQSGTELLKGEGAQPDLP